MLIILESSRQELAQRHTGPVKSDRAREVEEKNALISRDEYQERSRNVVHAHLVGAFRNMDSVDYALLIILE